jgi:hypothetical protein
MLIDKIKEDYLHYFELREDNMLDIVRIKTNSLDANDFLKIRLYLEKLEGVIIKNPPSFDGKANSDIMVEISRDYVTAVRDSILSFLVKEWAKEGYIYLPLFLLHYSFPAIKDFLTKWKQTQTDSPEFETLMNSSIYNSISHMDDLPNFDKNILNFSDKNHIAPEGVLDKPKEEPFCTKYLDEVCEKITPDTRRLFIDSTGNTYYYDYQIVSKNRINFPNTTSFITVYMDDGSKVLRPIPRTTITGQSINTTALVFIPKSIEVISHCSFINLGFLFGIIFEDGSKLRYIGGRQFTTDFLPKSFKLPDSVEVIGDKAFMLPCDCNIPLQFFCFPKNLKKIGKKAFLTIDKYQSGATMNRRLYSSLPEGVKFIGDFAFATGNPDIRLKRDKGIAGISLFTVEDSGLVYWSNSIIPSLSECKVLTVIGIGAFRRTVADDGELVIPPSVEEIGDYAFSCVRGLKKVIFSAGTKLKYLGKKAFFGCFNLSEVVFETPPPLERISYMAFAFTNLETIDLSNFPNLKVIEACAFVTHRSKYQKGIIQPKIIKNPKVIDYGPFRVREWFKSEDITIEKIKDGSCKSIDKSDFEYLRAPSPKNLFNTYKDTPEVLIGFKYEESCSFGSSIEDCTILEYLEYLNSDKYLNGESPRIPSIVTAGSSGEGVLVWDRRRDLTYIIHGTYSRIL